MSIIQRVQWTQNEAIDVLQQYKSAYQEHLLRKGVHHLIHEVSEKCKSCHKADLRDNLLHLQNIIDDALDMSRIETNKFEVSTDIFDITDIFL